MSPPRPSPLPKSTPNTSRASNGSLRGALPRFPRSPSLTILISGLSHLTSTSSTPPSAGSSLAGQGGRM
eukprot:8500126-Alexandrium_andersonii.AAC.1